PGEELDEARDIADVETGERKALRAGLTAQFSHHGRQRVPRRRIDVAIRAEHEQPAVCQFAGEELQEEQRRLVGGVEVVEDEDNRSGSRRAREKGCSGPEEEEARVLRVQRRWLAEIGEECAELGQQLAEVGR